MDKSTSNHPDFLAFQFAGKMRAFQASLNPKQLQQFHELMDFMFSLFGGQPEEDNAESEDGRFFIDAVPARRLTVKVTLQHVKPSVWRKFVIPSNLTLEGLSIVIEIAMGWDGGHLHAFRKGQVSVEEEDESNLTAGDVLTKKGDKITYEYDFGDSWAHVVELIADPEEDGLREFRLIGGKNACPPEDFGGPWYYTDFLEAWLNYDESALQGEFAETVEWLDEDFDPTVFDKAAVQEELDRFLEEIQNGD